MVRIANIKRHQKTLTTAWHALWGPWFLGIFLQAKQIASCHETGNTPDAHFGRWDFSSVFCRPGRGKRIGGSGSRDFRDLSRFDHDIPGSWSVVRIAVI
jgi:hypothetical protein